MRRCSTSELPSARGTSSPDPRHTPRQCRAHRTGMQARTAVDRSSMFRIGASDITSKTPIRVRSHPLAARAEASRHGASMRLRGFPCLGPAMSGCFGSAMQSRLTRVIPLCERQNENAPGCWNPRAFAWPREIGVTDLRDAKGSVDGGGAEIIPLAATGQKRIAPFARAQARIALGRWQQCSDVEGMRHGIRVFEESPEGEVAHLTRAFFVWQQNFYITDERRISCNPAAKQYSACPSRFDASHHVRDCRVFRPRKSPHRCGLFRFHPTVRLT